MVKKILFLLYGVLMIWCGGALFGIGLVRYSTPTFSMLDIFLIVASAVMGTLVTVLAVAQFDEPPPRQEPVEP